MFKTNAVPDDGIKWRQQVHLVFRRLGHGFGGRPDVVDVINFFHAKLTAFDNQGKPLFTIHPRSCATHHPRKAQQYTHRHRCIEINHQSHQPLGARGPRQHPLRFGGQCVNADAGVAPQYAHFAFAMQTFEHKGRGR